MKLFKSSIHKPWRSTSERICLMCLHVYDVCWTCSRIGPLFELHLTIDISTRFAGRESKLISWDLLNYCIAFMKVLLFIIILYG